MRATAASVHLPGYTVGTWDIDPAHSDISFTVRHLMVSKVRGHFRSFSGEIVTAEDPLDSSVTVTVDLASIDTNNEQRDDHVRTADFLDVATYPTMTYRSTSISQDGDGWLADGELSLHGVTRPVQLAVELNGFATDPWGGTRAGFSATAQINRRDFGIDVSLPMDGGGVVVGDKIQIALEIEAVLRSPDH
jgi:polyisoprenoid-binding protein YceI